jgi:nucleoside-diphosphate-sugar epimerase
LEVGTGRLTSVREIAERLVELVGTSVRPAFGALPDRPLERPRAALTEQTRLSIGWEARIPLEEGLLRTVASFKARGGPAP